MSAPLRIDIVSDVVCPWCIIGYLQLEQALRDTGVAHDIHWHPFELNPDMPPEGQDLRDHIAQKYGATREQSDQTRAQLAALGADLGFVFAYGDGARMYNTFDAHRLLQWAGTLRQKHALKLALFRAYFTDGRDVSDHETLCQVAAAVGLDAEAAAQVLRDGGFAQEVRGLEAFWARQGVQGVPGMVFDGKHLVTGAQGADNYAQILTHLTRAA